MGGSKREKGEREEGRGENMHWCGNGASIPSLCTFCVWEVCMQGLWLFYFLLLLIQNVLVPLCEEAGTIK